MIWGTPDPYHVSSLRDIASQHHHWQRVQTDGHSTAGVYSVSNQADAAVIDWLIAFLLARLIDESVMTIRDMDICLFKDIRVTLPRHRRKLR